ALGTTPIHIRAEIVAAFFDVIVDDDLAKSVAIQIQQLNARGGFGGQLGTPVVAEGAVAAAPIDENGQRTVQPGAVVAKHDLQEPVVVQVGHSCFEADVGLKPYWLSRQKSLRSSKVDI